MTKEYKKYLLSKEWAEIKIDLYNHRGRKCEKCGATKYLQVHHKHYKNIFKEEPEDLEILCKFCHQKQHNKTPKKSKKPKVKKRKLSKRQMRHQQKLISKQKKMKKQKWGQMNRHPLKFIIYQ